MRRTRLSRPTAGQEGEDGKNMLGATKLLFTYFRWTPGQSGVLYYLHSASIADPKGTDIMKFSTSTNKAVIFAASSLLVSSISASTAMAMPVGTGMGLTNGGAMLQQAEYGQHRVYPGSNSSTAKQARAARNAPNYFCDKQPGKCK